MQTIPSGSNVVPQTVPSQIGIQAVLKEFQEKLLEEIRADLNDEFNALRHVIGGLREKTQGLLQELSSSKTIIQKTARDNYILKAKLKAERTAYSLAQIRKRKLTERYNAEIKDIKKVYAQQIRKIQETISEAAVTELVNHQLVNVTP